MVGEDFLEEVASNQGLERQGALRGAEEERK